MPNRNLEGNYRYGYQGGHAEKEPELGGGINSFELRLWDARINRWLTPDPMGEFYSPYLAMGNNFPNTIDPDGGSTEDIIYLDSDGNEINRIAWEGEHIYMQETYNSPAIDGLQVGSFERVASPVKISFNPGIDKSVVSTQTLNTLQDIGLQSKAFNLLITSTARNAERQALAMYDNIIKNGMAEQRGTYRPPGQRVLDAYEEAAANGLGKQGILQAMTDRINEIGPKKVSNHAADPSVLNVVDIWRAYIPKSSRNNFFTIGNGMDGVRILNENKVFHVEVHQN